MKIKINSLEYNYVDVTTQSDEEKNEIIGSTIIYYEVWVNNLHSAKGDIKYTGELQRSDAEKILTKLWNSKNI